MAPGKIIVSNVNQFYQIASEAFETMNCHTKKNIQPKPNGETGYIKTYDPDQKSFKNALLTIVFCGVCLEALLHLLNVEKNGIETSKKFDREIYEEKLKLLGCYEPEILGLCENYRASRKEVIHEKAYLDGGKFKISQKKAPLAMDMINRVLDHFNVKMS